MSATLHPNRRTLLKASFSLSAVYLAGCGGAGSGDATSEALEVQAGVPGSTVPTTPSPAPSPSPEPAPTQPTPEPAPSQPTPEPTPAPSPPPVESTPTPSPSPTEPTPAPSPTPAEPTPAPSPPPAQPAPPPPAQGLSSLPPANQPVAPPPPTVSPLPAWLAPVGTVADLSLNTVDQAAGRAVNFWKAWSGVGWAPWWGGLGSVIIAGGGHVDGSQNDIYRFDVESRMVVRIKPTAPYFYKPTPDQPVADPLTGWMWANADPGDTTTQVGELFAQHEYSSLLAIPESAIPGQGASNGWLFAAGRGGMPLSASLGSMAGFKFRLGVDQKWTHQGPLTHANVEGFNPVSHRKGTCYDSRRRLVWFKAGAYTESTSMCYRNTVDGSSGYVKFSNVDGIDGVDGYQVLEYAAAHDCIVQGCEVAGSSPLEYTRLRVWDLVTGKVHQPPQLGTKPATPHETWAMCWSDVWNCMVFITGQGDNTVHFLKPTGNPRTEPWQWSSQTVTGVMRPGYVATAPSFNRLRHCTALGNVLIWCGKTHEPIQMIHVRAP